MGIDKIKKYVPRFVKEYVRKHLLPAPMLPDLPLNTRRAKLIEFYELKTGKRLNLENPVLFTEKLQWIKLYYKNNLMSRCVDKFEFKKYIEEKLAGGIPQS